MRVRALLLSGMWLGLLSSQMHASLVQDFELGTISPGTAGAGYTDRGPCVAGGANELELEGSYAATSNANDCHSAWFSTLAQDGSLFLAVNGLTSTGPVYQQTLTGLVSGTTYSLSAWFAGLYTLNPADITWNITAGGTTPANSFTTNTTGAWEQNGIAFIATGSTLTFDIAINTALASGNDFGIDSVDLTAVPEPGSLALVAMGMVALWGLRRKGRPATRKS